MISSLYSIDSLYIFIAISTLSLVFYVNTRITRNKDIVYSIMIRNLTPFSADFNHKCNAKHFFLLKLQSMISVKITVRGRLSTNFKLNLNWVVSIIHILETPELVRYRFLANIFWKTYCVCRFEYLHSIIGYFQHQHAYAYCIYFKSQLFVLQRQIYCLVFSILLTIY